MAAASDWWPHNLAHIPAEDPWAADYVIVAEIKGFEDEGHGGSRTTISALVPVVDIDLFLSNPPQLDFTVSTSGPRPYAGDEPYEPTFWVGAYGEVERRFEPLVLSWESHNQTVLAPDNGFLMTYGLIPRLLKDGHVHWDDMTGPHRDVVKVTGPSRYDFPDTSPASVSISKPYLQDYLSLRKMALVQSFWEDRFTRPTQELDERLGDKDMVDLNSSSRQMRLVRLIGSPTMISTEASGVRVVARPGALPVSGSLRHSISLTWPGISGPVDRARAMRAGVESRVYVSDRVLGEYEGRSDYQIRPENGSVRFGNQWAVGFCSRLGRDIIGVELKKLYEGVPVHVTQKWNEYAVPPPDDTSYSGNRGTPNVAKRAKALAFGLLSLGEGLADLGENLSLIDRTSEAFVRLDRERMEYSGWICATDVEAITRHIPTTMPRDAFLERGVSLTKFLIERLDERAIRSILRAMNVPDAKTNGFRALKLLDMVVRLCELSNSTGIRIFAGDASLWQRMSAEESAPSRPLAHLFALYDMRNLKAHRSDETKFAAILERFDVELSEAAAGHGLVLDRVYDTLISEIGAASRVIHTAVNA